MKYHKLPLEDFSTAFSHMHLQWFAPEDEGRTEEPTARKIRKAREEGKVAKSSDITAAIVMIVSLLTLYFAASLFMHTISDMLRELISMSPSRVLGISNLFPLLLRYLFVLGSPVLLVCFVAAIFGNVIQVGFLFSIKSVTPDFNRISPDFLRWAKRSFFSPEAFFNLFKSVVKILIIASLAYVNLRIELARIISTVKLTPLYGLNLIFSIAIRLMLQTSVLLLILAIPDYFFQRWQYRQSLKMSRKELREEFRETEGDPLIRNRLRQRMQEVLSSSMARQVPEADVVITNPTHFAVALKWDESRMQAPVVTAKGQDEMALQIKEIAKKSDVPTVENRPLARALYDNVELGDEVPGEYWEVISMILAEVYKLNGKIAG